MIAALSFITSPAGRFMALLAGALALYSFGYWKGHSSASRACDSAALRSEIAILKLDAKVSADAAARFEVEAKANADQAAKNQSIIDEVRNAGKNPACKLSDADARRLRSIK